MLYFPLVFWTILGLVLGSFFNVVIHRLPRGESIVTPPSHCPVCGHRLGVADLIPVLSYLLLKGRCRHCEVRIPPGYLIVELVTGTAFALIFLQHGLTFQTPSYSIFASLLIIAAGIDYHHGIIPNLIVTIGLVIALPFILLTDVVGTSAAVIGLAVSGGLMLAVLLISRGGMGMGDVKLTAMIGLYLGLPRTMLGLFLAFAVGALAGITLVMLNKKTRQDSIAFGPYLAGGALISLLWGESLLDLYARFLLP